MVLAYERFPKTGSQRQEWRRHHSETWYSGIRAVIFSAITTANNHDLRSFSELLLLWGRFQGGARGGLMGRFFGSHMSAPIICAPTFSSICYTRVRAA